MKILLSAYACKPNRGSEDGYGWNWAKSIAEINHEIWILTCRENQESIEKASTEQLSCNLHFIYVDTPNKLVNKIMDRTRFDWQYRYFSWQSEALKIAKKLDQEFEFDIIHHVTWGSITAGSLLWQLEKPFIFGPVGGGQTAPPALKRYFLSEWKNEALRSLVFEKLANFNWFSRKTISQADLVLATNLDTYELASRLGGNKIELFFDPGLPEDYFPEEFPVRLEAKELNLLWVGSLIPRKGLYLTLEALSRVSSSIQLKFTIIGSGSQSQYLPNWVEEFGLEKIVDYRGRLPWIEVKDFYLQSDIFLFTSLRDSCPTQFLEAMSHGLPIITLDIHGAKKLISDTAGIKVPVKEENQTVEALAQAIEFLAQNYQERLMMGKVGYEFAKTQIWSNKARSVTKYYDELLRSYEDK